MQLNKAFDPAALATALKDKGIQDAEKLVNDALPVVFDWLNTSVGMVVPSPYNVIATGVLADLEAKATAALTGLEAKV
jgi:hypothetical protein